MFPGMNSRQLKQAMKKMGIAQQDIEASQVIIKTPEKDIIINNPSVAKVNMMGQETFQISGQISEQARDTAPEMGTEDIQTVIDQTGADESKVRQALKETNGDLAQAIMLIKGD